MIRLLKHELANELLAGAKVLETLAPDDTSDKVL